MPALTEKVDTLNASGVIGVGWTTGISSYILDFGLYGAYVFMFILGYYSQKCWMRLLIFRNFYDVVVGVIVIMTALYMPLIPGFTETNVFLLWAFAAVLSIFSGNQRAARPVGAPIRTAAA